MSIFIIPDSDQVMVNLYIERYTFNVQYFLVRVGA